MKGSNTCLVYTVELLKSFLVIRTSVISCLVQIVGKCWLVLFKLFLKMKNMVYGWTQKKQNMGYGGENFLLKIIAEPLISSVGCLKYHGVQLGIFSEDLNMRRVAAKFVPRLLTDEQRKRRFQACFWVKTVWHRLFTILSNYMKSKRFATVKGVKPKSLEDIKKHLYKWI